MAERLLDGRAAAVPAAALGLLVAYAGARAPLLAVAGSLAAALALLVVTRVDLMLLVFVAIAPWEGALAEVPNESLSAVKLVGLLLFASYALWAVRSGRWTRPGPTLPIAAGLVMWMLIALLGSSDPGFELTTAYSYLLFFGLFLLVIQIVVDRASVEWVLRALTVSAALSSISSTLGFLLLSADRAGIGEPNAYAAAVGGMLPLAGYLYWRERNHRWLWGACFLCMTGAILATLSRGALVGLAAMAVWAVVARRLKMRGLLAVIAGVGAVLLLALAFWQPLLDERLQQKDYVASTNVASRQALWSAAIDMGLDHPVAGVGPGGFGPQSERYLTDEPSELVNPPAHNVYLELFAEGGIPGLGLFLGYLGGTWVLLSAAYRRSRSSGDAAGARLATALQAGFLVVLVAGFFLSIELTTPMWLLPALAVVVFRQATAARTSAAAAGAAPRAA